MKQENQRIEPSLELRKGDPLTIVTFWIFIMVNDVSQVESLEGNENFFYCDQMSDWLFHNAVVVMAATMTTSLLITTIDPPLFWI